MRRLLVTGLLAFCILSFSCMDLRDSYAVPYEAAKNFHKGKSQQVCAKFDKTMKCAMPCDSVKRVIRQTEALVGKPKGECTWAYTYQVTNVNPYQAYSTFKCPYVNEDVTIRVAVQVNKKTEITGMWADSPALRTASMLTRVELASGIDVETDEPTEIIEKADWSQDMIAVWTQWQGLKPGDTLAMSWRGPGGELIADHVLNMGNNPSKETSFWVRLKPSLVVIKDPRGEWTATISRNGSKVEDYVFVVEAKPETIAELPEIPLGKEIMDSRMGAELDTAWNELAEDLDKISWSSPKIYVWSKWVNLELGDDLIMEWEAPSGETVADYHFKLDRAPTFSYNYWSWIDPSRVKVKDPEGTWMVKIGVNGEFKRTHTFKVEVE
jgi:hypothetical protein